MNIDVKDVMTLSDNNEYVVVSKITLNNQNYYCISDINNEANIKICVQHGQNMKEINDEKTLRIIIPLLAKDNSFGNN